MFGNGKRAVLHAKCFQDNVRFNTKDYIDIRGVVVHHGKNDDGMGIWFKRWMKETRNLTGSSYWIIYRVFLPYFYIQFTIFASIVL